MKNHELTQLLEQLPNGIFVTDDGKAYFVNDGDVLQHRRDKDNPSADLIGGHEDPK